MGFIRSLEESVRADLSERVLLLHGLSGWPSPHGSYALCEVDLSSDGDLTGTVGGEKEVQFVIEAIPGTYNVVNSLENNRRFVDGIRENRKLLEGSNGNVYSESESLQGERGPGAEGVKEEEDAGVNGGAETIFVPHIPDAATHSTLTEGGYLNTDEGQDISFLSSKLGVLAPGVSIHPASYEALVVIVRELQCSIADSSEESRMLEPEYNVKEGGSNFEDHQEDFTGNGDTCGKRNGHPNLAPIAGLLQGQSCLYVIYPAMAFTFQSLLYFSPGALGDDLQIRFLIFQVLAAVAYSHKQGIIHGDLRPANVLLTENLWCLITGFLRSPKRKTNNLLSADNKSRRLDHASKTEGPISRSILLHPEPSIVGFVSDWREVIKGWWAGHISNYDYLLFLNKLAGRRWGDPCFHTVMPWVIDFSVKPDPMSNAGWRDLTKSKWRLAKGDEQLDFTYASAEMPHHVSDECLSELAVCIYKARRLPLLVLRRIVRSVYEPNEYPANMQRLYQWTPDECIPEFYSDVHIFESIHPGMSSLAVPTWAKDAKDFAALHRAALECDRVSSQLHHWIDLTFGFKLSGEAAVHAKNVTLSTVSPTEPRSSGRRQLFSKPHPRRQHCKTTDVSEKAQKPLFNLSALWSCLKK